MRVAALGDRGSRSSTLYMARVSDQTGSTQSAVGREDVAIDRIDLAVIRGPDAGKAISASRSRCVIGTADTADLVLTDPTVSRFHCEIVLEDGRASVTDLGAKNRTLVDGVAVFAAPIVDGTLLTLGNSTLRFAREAEGLRPLIAQRERFGGLVGRSRAMRMAFALLERAALEDVPVLLRGESGTGKDLAAASIHQESTRREAPFVTIDLAGASNEAIAAELFGPANVFERARGGTLYLDEIGDLDATLQRQLLRAIEMHPDVRVLASSHRDLRADVNARRIRSDLYFRIAVLEVVLPPLRERSGDIPLLVAAIAEDLEEPPSLLRDPLWIAGLLKHPWPGNVRELENHVLRAAQLGIPRPAEPMPSLKDARARWVKLFERQYLAELMQAHGGNVTAAARTAGVDRVHLYRLLGRSGLK